MKKSGLSMLPVLLWLCLFLVVPMLIVVGISFMGRDDLGNVVLDFNLDAYALFFDPLYLGIYWDTILLSVLTTALCLLLSYPLAYYIANAGPRMQTWGLVLITVPFWINFLIRTYAWVLLLRTQGIVNELLLGIGLISEPLQMLYTKGAVLLGMVYTFIPFMVLPIYVALEQMDKKLLEAASDLGATRWRSFWHITLPQTKSGIMTGSVLVYVSTTGMFVVTDILGGAKSAMISNIIQSQFLGARNWPFGSALSVIFVITSLILIALFNRAMTSRYQKVREVRS
ncbi:Spermidine/putrescine transport system permease protein PotB [compost metagenome]|jgi:spermidine/putrescine transport system permease protein|uniref:ABC transporter permease n=1 Tax=Paenibacillus rhizolycopersici TaxID=2780073 RepID=A0ABS2H544_9BACL|nr:MULTISPECIES: ABC transporter permease [Paenibacillus]MBM6995816.1 ABC transporter permease [Paenibacillus rhizolycopersici]MUG87234.1 ABC transporter permease subunit [Paenibacillus timonensis]GIP48959.1 spermidine/putrescine ABC transporter permease [Paenibacillus sp. J53TS2]